MNSLEELLVKLAYKRFAPTELHTTLRSVQTEYLKVVVLFNQESMQWPWYRILSVTIGHHSCVLKLPRHTLAGVPVTDCLVVDNTNFTDEHTHILKVCILDLIGQT